MTYDIIDADVLVVGAGGAGLRAAIEAHENGADVLVVSKGIVGKSGLTQTAVTGYQAAYDRVSSIMTICHHSTGHVWRASGVIV
jgi:succinate dehydrogenase/fumarate reductase flavoprotein subunit